MGKYRGRKIEKVPSVPSELGEDWLITWTKRPFYKLVIPGSGSSYVTETKNVRVNCAQAIHICSA